MMSTRFAWLVSGAALLVVAGTIAALGALVPSADSTAAGVTLYPSAGTPAAQGPNDAGHTLVQVGADLVADPPDYQVTVRPGDSVHSATALGEGNGAYVYGVLSTGDRVYLTAVDPGGGAASGQVLPYDEFEAEGIALEFDQGRVIWRANGDVAWER